MINLVSLRTFSCPQFYKPVTGQVPYFATQHNRWTSYIREIPKFKDLGFWTKRSNPAQCVTSPWRPLNAMLRWPFRKNLRHTVRSLLRKGVMEGQETKLNGQEESCSWQDYLKFNSGLISTELPKGGLISEYFLLWLKSPKMGAKLRPCASFFR